MTFDGVFTHAMVQELHDTLSTGRISKIHQPYDNELMLVIRSQQKNHTLLLSAHPSYARIQLTTIKYENPSTPPNFCMTMRKYLEGSILKSISQVDNDRIVYLHFERRNDLGDLEPILLIVEMMGRHSNIILINQESNKIIDAIKHIGPSNNSFRLILPGSDYVHPPTKNTYNPWTIDSEDLFRELNTAETLSASYLQSVFEGLSTDIAQELVDRMTQSNESKVQVFQSFFKNLENNPNPTIGLIQNKERFSVTQLNRFDSILHQSETYSALLDLFYGGKAEKDRVKQQAGELIKRINNDLNKTNKKIKRLEQSLSDADTAEIYRVKGELLTTFAHEVPKGATSVTLSNYYEEDKPITIQLNEALSVHKNAQKYFQRYQKLKGGVGRVKEQIEKAKYDAIYLESVVSQLDIASPSDIEIIKEELISERYLRNRTKGKQKSKQKPSQPLVFESSDGDTIWVGKNNLQNDQLTLKKARKSDIWLHAKNIPGSHVIISNDNPSDATLHEAALLAAYYSKYRLSASVPVDYVAVKHIKKPNGARPGFVIYEQQQTLYVTPEESKINSIKERK